jgi:hypothetical protein
MTRALAALLSFFALFSAYAQTAPAEAPQEPANMLAVVGFLVLFIGCIAGYIAYLAWQARKKPGKDD